MRTRPRARWRMRRGEARAFSLPGGAGWHDLHPPGDALLEQVLRIQENGRRLVGDDDGHSIAPGLELAEAEDVLGQAILPLAGRSHRALRTRGRRVELLAIGPAPQAARVAAVERLLKPIPPLGGALLRLR